MQQLFKCLSEEAVRNRLRHMPATLGGTYDEIYDEIKGYDEFDRKRADGAIMWVMCSRRPLGVDELLDAIRINTDDTEPWLVSRVDETVVLSLCNGLLIIDRERQVWGFPHFSVLEYFEEQPAESGRPNRHDAEECVANACLQFLNSFPGHVEKTETMAAMRYIRSCWALHIQSLEREGGTSNMSNSPTARRLKTFLGSPGESSKQYRRWYRDMTFTGTRGFQVIFLDGLDPVARAVFAMARLGIYHLLRDWWDDPHTEMEATTEAGYNLLTLAAISGSVPICRHIVARGLEVDSVVGPSYGFGSALAAAAYHGHLDAVEFLVEEAHATVDLAVSRGLYGSALAAAAHGGSLDVVKYLVNKKPQTVNHVLGHGHENFRSALAVAAVTNHHEIAGFLLDAGADVNLVLGCGTCGSALAAAALQEQNVFMVQLLVQKGADVNQVLNSGRFVSALFAALASSSTDSLLYLAGKGANIDSVLQSDIPTSMVARLVSYFRPDILYDLMNSKASMQRIVHEGILAPRLCGELLGGNNDWRMVAKALVQVGADVNTPLWDKWRGSCLESAAHEGKAEQVAFLVDECGARVNLASKPGVFGSAIAAAVCAGKSDVVKFLLEKGADLNQQAAASYSRRPADPNQRLRRRLLRTPLMTAAFAGRHACAELLLDSGADVNLCVEDCTFRNALEAAEAPVSRVDEDEDSETEDDFWAEDDSCAEDSYTMKWWNMDQRLDDKIREDRDEVASLLRSRGATAPLGSREGC